MRNTSKGKAAGTAADLSRRKFIHAGLAATGSLVLPTIDTPAQTSARTKEVQQQSKQPNLIFIYGEGQRADALSIAGHPILKTPNHDRIGREGVMFQNAFCTNALCAPARSTALTGMYSKSTGALDNKFLDKPLDVPYFTDLLRDAGYEIALVGKAHCRGGAIDRNWDYYFGFNAASTDYYRPRFIEGRKNHIGPETTYSGYADDIATDKALAWLAEPRDKPFCLLFWPQTPHAPFYRARRHLDLYNGVSIPKPSTFDDDLKGYPGKSRAFVEAKNKIGTWQNPDGTRSLEELCKDYYAGLVAVDEMIGRLFSHLEATGQMDETAIIHSSDHGYFLGEFRCFDKRLMHEPSIRVPLMIRYPQKINAGSMRSEMVLDIDIAPTILELAGVKPRKEMQGRSLVKLANEGEPQWRKEWFYDYYEYPGWEDVRPHRGIRTESHKLIHFYTTDEWEMYDLEHDPGETTNLYYSAQHQVELQKLKHALDKLKNEIPERSNA